MHHTAPELTLVHDKMFEEARAKGTEVYGDFGKLPAIAQAGHFRRMEIIEHLDIRDPVGCTSVDFGTGPWGFACVYPRLHASKNCISVDVSRVALEMAAKKDRQRGAKVQYVVSDGDEIPIGDSIVDIFWAGESLEHVRDPVVFLQEISRVCRDGADLVLSTPNRDAVFYQAFGQHYTIGPEHLALVNFAELQSLVDRFFDIQACHGFESSIWPEIDQVLVDPDKIRGLQERAFDTPELASGLILHGRNSKTKYAAHARTYNLIEQPWSDPQIRSNRPMKPMPLFGGIDGGLIGACDSISFAVPGRKIILMFWAHNWSGEAEILCDGAAASIDLFSRWAGFKRVVFDDLEPGPHTVAIRATGRRCETSCAAEVIFYKTIAYNY